MKSAYAKTKEKAEQGYYAEENSATEYAADKISHTADRVKDEESTSLISRDRNPSRPRKENIVKAKDKVSDFKQKRAMKAAEQKKKHRWRRTERLTDPPRNCEPFSCPRCSRKWEKPVDKDPSAREKRPSRAPPKMRKKTVKSTAKGTVKVAEKGVKTAQATSKTAIKTTEQTVKAAQKTAKASAKAAQKAAQAAKATAKAAAEATKATVKATIAAVKAIIAGTKALVSALIAGGWIAVVIILIVVLLGCAVSLFGGEAKALPIPPRQCGGGSLYAVDTEICEAVRHPRICGAYQGGDDAGKRRAWA